MPENIRWDDQPNQGITWDDQIKWDQPGRAPSGIGEIRARDVQAPVAAQAAQRLGGAPPPGPITLGDPMERALRANESVPEPFRSISRAQLGGVQAASRLADPRQALEGTLSPDRPGIGSVVMGVANAAIAPITEPDKIPDREDYQAAGLPPAVGRFAGEIAANVALGLIPHAPAAESRFARPTGGLEPRDRVFQMGGENVPNRMYEEPAGPRRVFQLPEQTPEAPPPPEKPPTMPQEARSPVEEVRQPPPPKEPPPPAPAPEEPLPEYIPPEGEPEFQHEGSVFKHPEEMEPGVTAEDLKSLDEQTLRDAGQRLRPDTPAEIAAKRAKPGKTPGWLKRQRGEPVKDIPEAFKRPDVRGGNLPGGTLPLSMQEELSQKAPELSPAASERLRVQEEYDAKARSDAAAEEARRQAEVAARPEGPKEHVGGLFGRTDLGRKLDQRDIDFTNAVEEVSSEAEKGPGNLGLAVKYGKGAGDLPVEKYFNKKAAGKNRVLPFPFNLFSSGGGYHGMNDLASVAPELAQSARRAANASPGAEAMTQFAKKHMEESLGKGTADWYSETKNADQQPGNVRRWQDNANEIRAADPHDVPDIYRDHAGDALKAIDESFPGTFDAAEKLANAVNDAKLDKTKIAAATKLQDLLVRVFDHASQNVTPILPPQELASRLASDRFKAADKIAKSHFLDALQEAHLRNDGHMLKPEYLGSTGYWPMMGKAATEKLQTGLMGRAGGPWRKPTNILNYRRTGLSPEYDTSFDSMSQKVGSAFWRDERASLINELKQADLLRKAPEPGKVGSGTYEWQGRKFKARLVGDGFIAPEPLVREIDTILGPKEFRESEPLAAGEKSETMNFGENLGRQITRVQTSLGVDKYFHYTNEIGQLMTLPAFGEGATRLASRVPVASRLAGIKELFRDVKPADMPEVQQMIQNAEWYPRMVREESVITKARKALGNAEAGPQTGELQPMSRRDLSARLAYRRELIRKANEEHMGISAQELYEAASHFGEYNTQLAPNLIRGVKRSTVGRVTSPFITAGQTFNRNALALAKNPRVLGTTLAGWALAHKAITGSFPDFGDEKTRILEIPYGTTADGRVKYINYGNIAMPLAGRFLGVTGVKGFANALLRGEEVPDAIKDALADATNRQLHPFTGPAVKVATRAIFGSEPQIEVSGGHVRAWAAHEPLRVGTPEWAAANLRTATEALNPAVERVAPYAEKAIGAPHKGFREDEGLNPLERAMRVVGFISVSSPQAARGRAIGEQKDLQKQQRSYARKYGSQ